MIKRIVLGLVVLAAAGGFLGAEEEAANTAGSNAKMAVGLDLFPLAKGLIWTDSDRKNSMFALAPSFEYLVRDHLSIGAAMDLYFGKATDTDILYFALAAHGRYYPLSSGLDRLFIDAGLGFNMFQLDGKMDAVNGGFMGLTMSLKTGYKLMLGPKFFFEPSMAFVYAKTASSASVPTPLGWQPGLSMGAAF